MSARPLVPTDRTASEGACLTRPDPILVKYLRFTVPMDCPGLSVASSCTASDRFHLEYHPVIRHHRIEYRPPSGPFRVSYIHESMVKSWDPMPAPAEPAAPELPPAKRK